LEHFTPHSLRHTFSTLQIAAGVDIRTLQARTGHAQASTLTNIYAHSLKSAAEAASDALDDILTPKNVIL
jgi:integrase